MSYRQCFFAVPTTTSLDAVRQIFKRFAWELRGENGYTGLYLAANSPQNAKEAGLWLLHLTATPAPRGHVSRDFFTERWSDTQDAPLYTAVYDDQHGIFAWQEHTSEDRSLILTHGHRVAVKGVELTVDHPQRAFTNAQLDEALRKPEEALTEAERAALMEYDDAITLGLRQLGSSATRADLLNLLYVKEVWPLLGADRAKMVPYPLDAGAVVSPYVERYTFEYCGLTPPSYY